MAEEDEIKKSEEYEEQGLAFANAEVVRLMKNNLPPDRMIKKRVKVGMNKFLEDTCVRICKKMGKEPFVYIEYDMFKKAIKPFEELKGLEIEKERLIASLNKIKADCDVMMNDVERKFSLFKENEEDEETC
ncbi:hypothetical protein COS83_03730 [archaeon CG07_land_8_20_14_0_80_38_8]|nr:MAG: hypothetical protein COS83_03730 [archaeon CG07_land_8_20_14_0_80_38_8]PIU89161.1 MAG: hypothetical protein COS64_01050 [archaeon CG06_land_8_20_14_3_00_37_11]